MESRSGHHGAAQRWEGQRGGQDRLRGAAGQGRRGITNQDVTAEQLDNKPASLIASHRRQRLFKRPVVQRWVAVALRTRAAVASQRASTPCPRTGSSPSGKRKSRPTRCSGLCATPTSDRLYQCWRQGAPGNAVLDREAGLSIDVDETMRRHAKDPEPLKKILTAIPKPRCPALSRVVTCHGDLWFCNVLRSPKPEEGHFACDVESACAMPALWDWMHG